MVLTYKDYQSEPKALTLAEMEELHEEIKFCIKGDEEALEIYDQLVKDAVRYASFRANWMLWSREERMDHDSSRSSCHDTVITKFNMLYRYLKAQGCLSKWRETLGDEKQDDNNRKRIGDFACYIVFVNSINAR